MMKAAVVLSCNLHWAPYYSRYERLLNDSGVPFDLILWNREGIEEKTTANLIEFRLPDETNNGSSKKVLKFLKYAAFVKKQLKKTRYDRVVFCGTYAGVPAFLADFLKKRYRGKYWIDMRDLTYEQVSFFAKLENTAIRNSYQTVVSSKGYLPYLAEDSVGFIHNIDPTMDEIYPKFCKTPSDRIRISYIGNIAYWDSCKEMIDVLANDDRFVMNFVGPNHEPVKEYCEKNGIRNVSFHGRFPREDTVLFYNDTDIIFNLYGSGTRNVKTALSNKLYYGMRFRLPVLVNAGTYMEEIIRKYHIGFVFENTRDFADRLYAAYVNFDHEEHSFDQAWRDVKQEDDQAIARFAEFIEGIEIEENSDRKQ